MNMKQNNQNTPSDTSFDQDYAFCVDQNCQQLDKLIQNKQSKEHKGHLKILVCELLSSDFDELNRKDIIQSEQSYQNRRLIPKMQYQMEFSDIQSIFKSQEQLIDSFFNTLMIETNRLLENERQKLEQDNHNQYLYLLEHYCFNLDNQQLLQKFNTLIQKEDDCFLQQEFIKLANIRLFNSQNQNDHSYSNEVYQSFMKIGEIIQDTQVIQKQNYETNFSNLIQDIIQEKRQILQSKLTFKRVVYSEGEKYKGLILDKKREGFGSIKYNNSNDHYNGFWKNNKRHGIGTATCTFQTKYTGIIQNVSEGIYTGEWIEDKRDGKGQMEYSDKSLYDGMWNNDKKQGEGIMYLNDGSVQKGNWVDDYLQGKGELQFTDKSIYKGNFIKGNIHGHGTLYKNDGFIFEGFWINLKKNGKFIVTNPDGQTQTIYYQNDQIIEN